MFNEEIIKAFSKPSVGWVASKDLIDRVEQDIKKLNAASRKEAIDSLLVDVKTDICTTKMAMNVNMIKGRKRDLIGGVSEEEQEAIDNEMALLHNVLNNLKERLWYLNSL